MIELATSQERRAVGQSRRKQLRRQDHCNWEPQQRRHDPIAVLEESMRGRVPSLIALKYERMAASPFGFFRGAVPVMAADFSLLPHTGIVNQICGDAHVRNLGAYAAPDGRLVFDINDFDETIRGPFEWDLKRMATSLLLAGRTAGIRHSIRESAVARFVGSYRESIHRFAAMPMLQLARYQIHRLEGRSPIRKIFKAAE